MARPWMRASSMSGVMSAMWPYMCTGMTARVRGVILRATSPTSRHQVSGSQSTNTGTQPARSTASAQEMMEARHDDLGARRKLERLHGELERRGAVAERNAVPHAAILRPLPLELGD